MAQSSPISQARIREPVMPMGDNRSWCSATARLIVPSRTRPPNSQSRTRSGTKGSDTRMRLQSRQRLPFTARAAISSPARAR